MGKLFTVLIIGLLFVHQNKSSEDHCPMVTCTFQYQDRLLNVEYIEMDSVLINGNLPLKTDTSTLFKNLGKPTFVVIPDYDLTCASYFEKDFKYLYFKGTQFEVFKEKAICRTLNFQWDNELFLKTPNLTLTYKTTIEELKRYFPDAVSKQKELDVVGIGKSIGIGLATSKNLSDDRWFLLFKDGTLSRIDYWLPC